MDAVVASVLSKVAGQQKGCVDPGVHQVNLDIRVDDNITGEVTNLNVEAQLPKVTKNK